MIDVTLVQYVLAAAAVIGLLVYTFYPILLLQLYFRVSVWQSGMRLNYVSIDGLSICYGERGQRKKGSVSMLLLHGFTADKFMWVPLVKNLPNDIHIIAVDLPGHGDSDAPTDDYDISHFNTVTKMHKLIDQIGFNEEPYHLVGMSMGGALAGLYAAQYTHEVHSVTMICPAMKTPVNSPFWSRLLQAVEDEVEEIHMTCDLLFPKTATEVRKMVDYVNYNKMWIPTQILHAVAEFRKQYYPFYSRLFKTITDPEMHDLLSEHVPKITVPSQIMWGEHDQVIDVSGAEHLRKRLPDCRRVDIIPRCGHSVGTDRPGAMTKLIKLFRKDTEADR